MQNSVCAMLQSWLASHVCLFFVVDRGVEGDLPLSLHHVAWLWCPRIPRLLPQFPLQGSGVWLIGPRAWALSGALQRWDWTLGDLRLGGHLPGPGEGVSPNAVTVKEKCCLIFTLQTKCYYSRDSSCGKRVRCYDYASKLWRVDILDCIKNCHT